MIKALESVDDMQPDQQRLKVLAIAYACSPHHGSEPGVGWGWVDAIARHHDVWVLTADFHRRDLEDWLNKQGSSHIHVCYLPPRAFHYQPTATWEWIAGSVFKPALNLAYASWQRDAYRMAVELHRREQFDLVHLITLVGFRFPGKFYQLDAPYVWGPIGGLENTPWRFLPSMGLGGAVYYAGRNLVNSLQKAILPGPRRAFRRAEGGVIAATEGVRREIARTYGVESEVICEIGVRQLAEHHAQRQPGEPLELCWSGQHLPGKALPFLLRALARLPDDLKWRLHILGAGRCTRKWQQLATRLGLGDRCDWAGWLPRQQAVQMMHQCHVFVITSLKDLTSSVLLEALSQGLPVVCPDHCGFANVVDETCGIKLPLQSPQQLERDLAAAIGSLADDEDRRRRLARGALQRCRHYTWDAKAEAIHKVYQRKAPARCLESNPRQLLSQP